MAPFGAKKMKFCISQISLDSFISVKFRHLFKFYRCYGNQNGRQNRHKIEKLPFLTKIKAFRDRIFKN